MLNIKVKRKIKICNNLHPHNLRKRLKLNNLAIRVYKMQSFKFTTEKKKLDNIILDIPAQYYSKKFKCSQCGSGYIHTTHKYNTWARERTRSYL